MSICWTSVISTENYTWCHHFSKPELHPHMDHLYVIISLKLYLCIVVSEERIVEWYKIISFQNVWAIISISNASGTTNLANLNYNLTQNIRIQLPRIFSVVPASKILQYVTIILIYSIMFWLLFSP